MRQASPLRKSFISRAPPLLAFNNLPGRGPAENQWPALLGSCPTARSLARIHGWLVAGGLGDDLSCQTKLASTYASLGDMDRATAVFERIQNPDLYSWKVMLRWYLGRESYAQAIGVYARMRLSTKTADNIVFSGVLKAAAELRNLREGRRLHCDIVKVGNPDDFVLNSLLDMYAKCGAPGSSRRVFDKIPNRDVVSWTSMISGYVQNGHAEEGLILFNQMRKTETDPNGFTVGTLLAACSKLEALQEGRWIHGYVIKRSMNENPFLVTGLLDMYAKCGMVADARRVFDELPAVDLISCTAMIAGYTQGGHPLHAVKLFSDVRSADMVPNSFTVASIVSAAAQLEDRSLGKTAHGLAIKFGLEEEVEVRNALLTMYAKCGLIPDADHLFDRSPHRDVIAWNAMMAGYSQNGLCHEALLLFARMRSTSAAPDAVTFVNALSACAGLGDLSTGSQCHSNAAKCGVLANVFVGTALLDLYAKCGDAESARVVFDGMTHRSQVTWCAMIGGYGVHGDSGNSLSLFREMLGENLPPNDATFTAILSACGHAGMVGEGQEVFYRMCRDHKIFPSMKHYSCIVDLLARAGRLDDAMEFIGNMPAEADAAVWGAFLHGCRVHSRMELGESAVHRMLDLHPQNASYYLLMSNLYASEGRWREAAKIRELMKSRGLSKSPGCSLRM
ncbi:unnamed protein product [Spirodela intermedia]|uniref:Uncharacterized protein n=1 Tax=Spirodela intermedia TaxID=51605 RepID=A0A7I8K931_SPIIN|nr:unnamed protein product [Spirodela intermedia]